MGYLSYEAATVDEFIAWFRTNFSDWEGSPWKFQDVSAWACETDQPDDHPSVTFCLENRHTVNFHGPTLLDACRAAFVGVNQ